MNLSSRNGWREDRVNLAEPIEFGLRVVPLPALAGRCQLAKIFKRDRHNSDKFVTPMLS